MTKLQKLRNLMLATDLESGAHKQTKGALREDDKFCCLGRACDVYSKETGKGRWKDNLFVLGKRSYDDLPPDTVSKWFGWVSANPVLVVKQKRVLSIDGEACSETEAAYLNDSGVTFKQIAKGFRALAAAEE